MSLINKMLSDLEHRQSFFKDQDQIVLGGLAPVVETGFSSSRIPYDFLLMCFFIVALGIATYGYLGNAPYKAQSIIDVTGPAEIVPAIVNTEVTEYQVTTINSADIAPLITQELARLKLDMSLPLQTSIEVTPVASVAQIRNITISLVDEVTSIQLLLDRSVEFKAYTLAIPGQAVLEIENALIQASIPAIAEHPYIERLRFSNNTGENFKLMIDSRMPVLIENTEMIADTDGYILNVRLKSSEIDRVELMPTVQDVVPAEETQFGRMQVTPSITGTGINIERSLAEARQLYSDRDFKKADETALEILKQQPLHIKTRSLYVSALIKRGNIDTAMQVLEAGLQLDPAISEWANVNARLLVDRGLTDQAISVLAKALPEISTDNDYYAFYAALLQKASRHDEASDIYRALVAQQSDNGLWWMGMAISLDALKNKEDALHSYNKALEGQALTYELRQYVLQQIERLAR